STAPVRERRVRTILLTYRARQRTPVCPLQPSTPPPLGQEPTHQWDGGTVLICYHPQRSERTTPKMKTPGRQVWEAFAPQRPEVPSGVGGGRREAGGGDRAAGPLVPLPRPSVCHLPGGRPPGGERLPEPFQVDALVPALRVEGGLP